MKSLYSLKSVFIFYFGLALGIHANAQSSSVYFSLEACNATLNGEHQDYSEFIGQITNSECANLNVQSGHIYRNNPLVNAHSCTPGVNAGIAMCIGSNPACTFTPNSDQALRMDILVTPGSGGSATFSELTFYEKGPAEFVWINGDSGPNNYPTRFGVRIVKNGTQIFLSPDNLTELNWNLNTFNFSGPDFTVTQPTVFNIEILPYCPVGNGAAVSAWDIDEVRVIASCCDASGGLLTGGPFEFCVGDGIPDHVTGVVLSGQSGPNTQFVITDMANNILNLPTILETVNFDGLPSGPWRIWSISFEDGLTGLVVGNNLLTDLVGCFGFSNSLDVARNDPEGGALTGGPFEFCAGDTTDLSGIILSGNAGPNSQFVVTNGNNTILMLPGSTGEIDLSGMGPGTFLVWNITFFNPISGLIINNNLLSEVTGCFDLSNAVTVVMNQPDGGVLTGGPFEFCVGDSIPDYVTGVVLSGNTGEHSQWVVTNEFNTILSLPANIDSVNFDGAGPGICLIWNISYFDPISGLVPGNNLLTDVSGCFDLSNSITVNRNQPVGGTLTGGPFEFCVGDSMDFSGIILSGNQGPNSQIVVTNNLNIILGLPGSMGEIDFDGSGPGTFFIYNISFFDTLSGLVIDNDLFSEVTGCFSISNAVTVVLNQPDGGVLTGGPFEFCVGDSIHDHVTGIVLSGNVGDTSQWVITNELNVILSLPSNIDSVNFDGGGSGICLIWNISYFGTISGLVPGNNLLTDVTGCFDLSNSITVIRNEPIGGLLTGGPFEFCAGDTMDFTSIILSGNEGENFQFVVTDDLNTILGLPGSLADINLNGNGPGTFFIYNVSFFDTLSGLIIDNDLFSEVTGCMSISNPITVELSGPDGGELTGGPFEFCVGDSIPDFVTGIVLSGAEGETQWVITNADNTILSLPESLDTIDFDSGGPGVWLIWNLSFIDPVSGLVPGNDLLTDVTGCFGLSNPITVNLNQPEGGVLTGGPFEFCVGDSIPDHVSGVDLTGNIGDTSQWVVTNELNIILSLPENIDSVNFDGGGPGICLIWNISYFNTITGLVPGNNLLTDVAGCFDLSNSITVNRNEPDGGDFTGGPFEFCVGDSIADFLSGIELLNNVGDSFQLVITDDLNTILSFPDSLDTIDFNEMDPGTILIWNVSFFDTLGGFVIGNDLFTEVTGCLAFSNPITVELNQPEGGELIGGPFEFCVGDTIPDFVTGIELVGNAGSNSQYVVTDSLGIIQSLPVTPGDVDFNESAPGICLIYHVSYDGTLTGLEEGNNLLTDLEGCFSISNAITVVKMVCEGVQGGDPVLEVKISPNPVREKMKLEMVYTGEKIPVVQIFDASGRLHFKQDYQAGHDMTIDMNNFAEGVYFIRVQSDLGNKTQSIVVIK